MSASVASHRATAPAQRAIPSHWRTLLTPPLSGAENMALDDALMERARRTGEPLFRVYGWVRPTLSLGRNQAARGRYDPDRIRHAGVDVVRRPTGGRAILHHHEVTYSVTAPVNGMGTLAESYHWINRLLLEGLARLGVAASEAVAVGRTPLPGVTPCFQAPVAGEIVANGRKLVGSAQFRERGALLQHGSILIHDDQSLASSLLVHPLPPPPPPATLADLLGAAPLPDAVAHALFGVLDDAQPLTRDDELKHDMESRRPAYEDPGWTWRR
ncbi:MAG: lipoate--protein ligase family protein [Gemmatimonadaceae bacterium]